MPRKLKTFVTTLGFYELAIAAPTMKAALAAWGLERNAFQHGFAKQTDDPKIIAAAEAVPGSGTPPADRQHRPVQGTGRSAESDGGGHDGGEDSDAEAGKARQASEAQAYAGDQSQAARIGDRSG